MPGVSDHPWRGRSVTDTPARHRRRFSPSHDHIGLPAAASRTDQSIAPIESARAHTTAPGHLGPGRARPDIGKPCTKRSDRPWPRRRCRASSADRPLISFVFTVGAPGRGSASPSPSRAFWRWLLARGAGCARYHVARQGVLGHRAIFPQNI